MGSFSIWHWLVVLVVVLVLFGGGGKISRLMGDMAKGVKAFKKGLNDDDDDDKPVQAKKNIEGEAANQAQDSAPVADDVGPQKDKAANG